MQGRESDWLQISIEATPQTAERLSEQMTAAGALSVTLEDSADDPVLEPAPGEVALWPHIRATGLFAPDTDAAGVLDSIQQALGLPAPPECRIKRLADRDWTRVWMDGYGPMRFGERLWVCPVGRPAPDPDAVTVSLDPGLAFGTGTHPTTALCLEWLARHPVAGQRVIDYGCGSGILAIAAARLGAHHVWAVDVDPQALHATRENARQNGVEGRITTVAPSDLTAERADCVLANILARPLIELAPRLVRLTGPGAALVLTGILHDQVDDVAAAYREHFEIEARETRDDWAMLVTRRKD